MTFNGQPSTMYRQQQLGPPQSGHYQQGAAAWFAAGYHQPTAAYCLEQEQPLWHHHHAPHPHGVFQHEFQDFIHTGGVNNMPPPAPAAQLNVDGESLHSGSDMSSPGTQIGELSPPQQPMIAAPRPPQARSPFEWIKKNAYQTQPNPGKTRTKDKYRVVYTDHQRIELEKEFTFQNKYITIRRKAELAANLGLSERQIKIWFQNRRAKERKVAKKKMEEKDQLAMNGAYPQQNPVNPIHSINSLNPINSINPINSMAQIVGQHHQPFPHLNLHQQQPVLPNLVPSTSMMQRFMESNHHPLKIETSDTPEQINN